MIPHDHRHHEEALLRLQRHRTLWRRGTFVFGMVVLLSGYALLAISPDTPSDWVLIRVAAGFGLLFVGFGLAILPWLARAVGSDD